MREFLKGCNPIYEISSESGISGRRPIKVVLHEIHPDDTHYQWNGISWNEEYTRNNLPSVAGMSIVAEFLNEDRDVPYGHGMTDIRDNMPLFEDATMVGHFDRAYVDDLEIGGELKRVLVAEGTLDEMRYPKFVAWLKEHMAESEVKGSVEIVGKPENDKHIIYSDGWKEVGRVPQVYDYSGYAILGIKPADGAAIVVELNSKVEESMKEEFRMDEKILNEIKSSVIQAVTETNAKNEEFQNQINELNAQIEQLKGDVDAKDAEIAELNAKVEQAAADLEAKDTQISEVNAKVAELENEKAVNELNAALAAYTDEQKECVKDEIEAFKADPTSVEINSIVGKICTEIVRQSHNNTVTETNSVIDVFGMVDPVVTTENDDDVDVF